MAFNGRVEHYRIYQLNGILTCDHEENFDNLTQLIAQASLVIRRGDLRLGDTIGHGEFGDVLLGDYNGCRVAVKVLKRNAMVQSLLDEAKFMIGLKHTNLVALLGVVIDDAREILMVTEYMANGNLVDFLRSRGRHQLEK
ncbi:unnamed protein product, partial [Gongylonema pulchrum]|uniref:Non-specific protein-tyrosine kinase n=1 Tax=Gongylonema pulchrum TaxID=637853 RepID=A0A183DRQ3_9BILA